MPRATGAIDLGAERVGVPLGDDWVLTTVDVANLLQKSVRTAQRLFRNGDLPAVRIGSSYFLLASELRRVLAPPRRAESIGPSLPPAAPATSLHRRRSGRTPSALATAEEDLQRLEVALRRAVGRAGDRERAAQGAGSLT